MKDAKCGGRLLPCLVQSPVFEAVYSPCPGGYGLAKVSRVSSPSQGRCGVAPTVRDAKSAASPTGTVYP